jgi:hypothetical protein
MQTEVMQAGVMQARATYSTVGDTGWYVVDVKSTREFEEKGERNKTNGYTRKTRVCAKEWGCRRSRKAGNAREVGPRQGHTNEQWGKDRLDSTLGT